jgi:hypothetical protein
MDDKSSSTLLQNLEVLMFNLILNLGFFRSQLQNACMANSRPDAPSFVTDCKIFVIALKNNFPAIITFYYNNYFIYSIQKIQFNT